jgi:uncharacterized protein YuzE
MVRSFPSWLQKRRPTKLMVMLLTYDSSADAAYIYVQANPQVARSITIDDFRVVDLNAADEVVGIEILSASGGFELEDIIKQFKLESRGEELRQAAAEFRPAAQV